MSILVFLFCSSGLRIIKAAAENINETFDGILGANSRASSSYSACRPTQRRSKLKLISWDIWVKPTDFVYSVQTGPTEHQMQSCVNKALSSRTYALICAVYVHLIYFQIKFYCHCKRAVPCMTTPNTQQPVEIWFDYNWQGQNWKTGNLAFCECCRAFLPIHSQPEDLEEDI